jgi:hypothetical protein
MLGKISTRVVHTNECREAKMLRTVNYISTNVAVGYVVYLNKSIRSPQIPLGPGGDTIEV